MKAELVLLQDSDHPMSQSGTLCYFFLREHTNKTVKKNMQLILNSSKEKKRKEKKRLR